jgi:hypothetical protein
LRYGSLIDCEWYVRRRRLMAPVESWEDPYELVIFRA